MGWCLLLRRAVRRRASLPSTRWSLENMLSAFTAHPWCGFQEACPLGTQRNTEICHEGDGDTRCEHLHQAQQRHLGQRYKGCPILDLCAVVQENVIKMEANQTSSTHWLLTCLLPLSKIYRQLVWLRPNCWLSNKVIELPRKKECTGLGDFPGGPEVKNLPCNAGDMDSTPGEPVCSGAVHHN